MLLRGVGRRVVYLLTSSQPQSLHIVLSPALELTRLHEIKTWQSATQRQATTMTSNERFHSRGQHTCKFTDTKGSVYIRKSSTWPLYHCFGTPIWLLWRHVKTLCIFQAYVKFQNTISHGKENVPTRVGNAIAGEILPGLEDCLLHVRLVFGDMTWKSSFQEYFLPFRCLRASWVVSLSCSSSSSLRCCSSGEIKSICANQQMSATDKLHEVFYRRFTFPQLCLFFFFFGKMCQINMKSTE